MNTKFEDIDILSLNCRGLRSKFKRQRLFSWLSRYDKGIIMLQETHTDKSVENDWIREYAGKVYFSHGASNGRGVAILLPQKSHVSICVMSVERDLNGRILLLNVEIEGNPLVIVSIYAPTKDSVELHNSFPGNLLVQERCSASTHVWHPR